MQFDPEWIRTEMASVALQKLKTLSEDKDKIPM